MKHVIYGAILSAVRRLGSAVSSPSGVWGGARAEIEFDAWKSDIWWHQFLAATLQ